MSSLSERHAGPRPTHSHRMCLTCSSAGPQDATTPGNYGASFAISRELNNDTRYWFHSGGAVAANGDAYLVTSYGDYLEVQADSTGHYHAIWGEGISYSGPGGTWYTRSH